ncbi:MAG: aminotransferase class I/II-fold pyridoxal phosphate-dependent enzyme [Acidobacteria bacterium]|nr:aminotransferase class I/II-fold pyridoxal phosphate-dependent enzyme [Acidobacteriota bacterium]
MFNPRTAWPTAPTRLAARLQQLRRQETVLYDLTESNPTRCGFVYDDAAIQDALSGPGVMRYDPAPKGIRSARQAVANYYEERGMPIPTDRVILTSGSSEAYLHCFRLLCEPGDQILAPKPSYPLFDFLADMAGIELVHYPLVYDHGWEIDLQALKAAITPKTKAILVVSPNNPTGQLLSTKERDMLTRYAIMNDLALIVDEVFFDYTWEESSRMASFDSRCLALTLTISGLSKISALPQMKLGWITVRGPVGPDADATARLEVMADTLLSVSTPTQLAAGALLAQRKLIQPQIKERLLQNLEFLDAKLSGNTPVSRLKSEAGWYAILRVPNSLTDEEWAVYLLETASVYTHPGHLFGFDREGYLVISLLPEHQDFREAVGRLVESID